MRYRFLIILLSFFVLSCSVYIYGQEKTSLSVNDISGISKHGIDYEVTGDVNLRGKILSFPQGCTVMFNGGRVSNGIVVFNNNLLKGDVHIDGDFEGKITNDELKAEWFGIDAKEKRDQTKRLQSMINLFESNVPSNPWDINLQNPEPSILLPAGKFNVGEINLRSYITIKGSGRGSTELCGVTFKASGQYNITLEDISLTGYVGTTKASSYDLNNNEHSSAILLRDCARLIFKNVCIKNYDVAFDMYNSYLIDLYSCFVSYCNVCYFNDGKGSGYGGHAIRWFGGEMNSSKYGFVQKKGNGVLLNGSTIEGCYCGIYLIAPSSFSINACYFEGNNYDIYGSVVHINIENNLFSENEKSRGDAYIYAPKAIGYAVIQGNAFGNPVFDNPHIMVDDTTHVYGNILIGQNDIVHGGRIPVSERLKSYIYERGVNIFQTYLPEGNSLLLGQTIIYQDPQTGQLYFITRDIQGNLKYLPFKDNK